MLKYKINKIRKYNFSTRLIIRTKLERARIIINETENTETIYVKKRD